MVSRGCPQGYVLSPLVWCLVVHELLTRLNGGGVYTQGYADDICLLAVGKFPNRVSGLIQWALYTVETWCDELGLSVNPNKTGLVAFMRIRKLPGIFEPCLFGKTLRCSMSVKYLGVILDLRLTWRKQVDVKVRKAHNLLWACRRAYGVTLGLRPWVVYWIYVSIIRPSVTFASLVRWPGCQTASAKKKTKQGPKTNMLRYNRSNAHSHQCCGSTYLPPPTGVSCTECGEVRGASSLESGKLDLPTSRSRT